LPLLSISYVNFRNIQNGTIDLNSKEVFFVGENGQGKSNLLESVYYLAYGSSFRTRSDSEIIRNGESAFSLRTLFKKGADDADSVFISLESASSSLKKKIVKNGKSIKDRKELVSTMPCVLFCHDDLEFAVGEPERRRFFVDQCLSMFDMYYIDVSRNYRKILKSRNLSLKQQQYNMLDVYDLQLCDFGLQIQKKRNDAIFKFNQIFAKLYEKITGIDNVSIRYSPSWKSDSSAIPQREEVLKILSDKRDADRIMATTMSGPHRDRIRFVRNGSDFVATASTGQRRLLAILLRVSQAIFYTQATEKRPILLMDDVLLELDPEKRQHVTSLLPEYDQLFCTFLPGEPYERYSKSTTRIYEIKGGGWNELQKGI
jgi:DNA replication and repair protein RecF